MMRIITEDKVSFTLVLGLEKFFLPAIICNEDKFLVFGLLASAWLVKKRKPIKEYSFLDFMQT